MIRLAVALLVASGIAAARSYRNERRGFLPSRRPPRIPVAGFDIPGLTEASFMSHTGAVIRGVYAAPRAGAVVVLTHGSGGERSDLVHEARILASAGFGVLAFDWPGHGESDGSIEWGEAERSALAGALDWLSEQPGVDANRLGAFGFSMGGYILAQQCLLDDRLRAVALAGTPHDPIEHTRWEYRRGSIVTQWPALLALRVSGMDTESMTPERVLRIMKPRALLVVTGTEDEAVPPWMAKRLLDAASEPKELLSIGGARHGGYHQAEPERYARRLVEFFGVLVA